MGEIETLLNDYPQLRNAVMVSERIHLAEAIAAYLVLEQAGNGGGSTTGAISESKTSRLYGSLLFCDDGEFPLTPNGKVDRKALPDPQYDAFVAGKYVAPRTPTEEIVANIYAQVLSVKQVGIYDNFFELGGHSLLATQALSRLQEAFGVVFRCVCCLNIPAVEELGRRNCSIY